jgi:hypothetical protein
MSYASPPRLIKAVAPPNLRPLATCANKLRPQASAERTHRPASANLEIPLSWIELLGQR